MTELSLNKGDLLTEPQLDNAVHDLIRHALSQNMIPIAGILSRRQPDGRHKILGFGWNHLREGIPGIHGETGAIISMGRLKTGYRDVTATSSLSPCPFCQCCLALHMGIKEIRILDAVNYTPDFAGYQKVGLNPIVANHPKIAALFKKWVRDPKNATIWNRDIGIWNRKYTPPFDIKKNPARTKQLMSIAHQKARDAFDSNEAPIGAVIVDPQGEVLGAGCSMIAKHNDPSLVAAMSAWRACGARDHWKDKTLFLTAGPDSIAYSMFHIFNFGQLVTASDKIFPGQTKAIQNLNIPLHLLRDTTSDGLLKKWMKHSTPQLLSEYLGCTK